MIFVLVHSPLVGPSTWAPIAGALERRGQRALVASLLARGGVPPLGWRQCVEAVESAAQALPGSEPVVLVGHSGGGLLLPPIADALTRPVATLLFVDSDVPVPTGKTPFVPPFLLEQLRSLSVDGVLPPWSTWFGEEVMRELVPDDAQRSLLAQEMPSLPLAFLEQSIPSPIGWDRLPCAYLLLSEAYRDAAAEAKGRGWRVEEIGGAQHLHIVVAPDTVADALIRLAGA